MVKSQVLAKHVVVEARRVERVVPPSRLHHVRMDVPFPWLAPTAAPGRHKVPRSPAWQSRGVDRVIPRPWRQREPAGCATAPTVDEKRVPAGWFRRRSVAIQ